MWWLVVLAAGLLGTTVVLGSRDMVTLTAGKRYRFFFKVKPGLNIDEVAGLVSTLGIQGAVNIDTHQGPSETTGSYVMTATTTKQVAIGKPIFDVEYTLSFTAIQEIG